MLGRQMKLIETLENWQADFTTIRRSIHMNPEIAFNEHDTADKVASLLTSWGVEVRRGIGKTGVVGCINGRAKGRALGLRADMDALPITEANNFAHASRNPGLMHACGHDGHTTMLLAAARYLAEKRDFDGSVYVIFQPAEEGAAGARFMIEDGLFESFAMDAVFGMHNWPGLPVGSFGLTAGPIMASSNSFKLVINGRGGHGAMPNLGIDPVVVAAQLTLAFQSIITRELDPLEAAVISVTQIHTGTADNVIPDQATLSGTVRTLSEQTLDIIEQRLQEISQSLAQAMRCGVQFSFKRQYPVTFNHAAETDVCRQVINALVGPENLRDNVRPSMGAEDFAFMLKERPGCYVWIGNGDGQHRSPDHGPGTCSLHNSSYDFNDALIPLGASYWVRLAQKFLSLPA